MVTDMEKEESKLSYN